jgi:hypothetical protein
MSRNASTCKLHCSDVLCLFLAALSPRALLACSLGWLSRLASLRLVVQPHRPEVLTSGLRWLPDSLSDFVTPLGLTQRASPRVSVRFFGATSARYLPWISTRRRPLLRVLAMARGLAPRSVNRVASWKHRSGEYRSRGATLHETHRRADHPKRSERLTSASIRVSAAPASGFAIISFDARACCAREKGVAVSPCGKASPPHELAKRAGAPRGFLRRGAFGGAATQRRRRRRNECNGLSAAPDVGARAAPPPVAAQFFARSDPPPRDRAGLAARR